MEPAVSPDNTVAIVALVVSICSASVTLGGLVWQLVLYRLQGARLKVQMLFRYQTGHGMTVTVSETRRRHTWQRANSEYELHWDGIEYALVRVTNIGRTAVSVEGISFDLGRTHWYRRGRSTVTPIEFNDPSDENSKPSGLTEPRRLDPGANVSVGLHLWPALADPKLRAHRGRRRLVVRATAQAVGRRPTRSARRYAWRFRAGDPPTWFRGYTPGPDTIVYRRLFAAHQDRWYFGGQIHPLAYAREIVERLNKGATEKDLFDLLNERIPDGIHHMLAHDLYKLFHRPIANPRTLRQRIRRAMWGVQDENFR